MKPASVTAVLAACVLSATMSLGAAQKPVRDNAKPTPVPTCTGWSNCHVGTSICQDVTGWDSLPLTIAGGYSLRDDGRGAYVAGTNVKRAGVGVDAGMVLLPYARSLKNPRAIALDLNNPVPGGGGIARGVITDNGVYHVLQMGPQPSGHCYSGGTAIHGTGTTPGTIFRVSALRWEIDLPVGSIGRLFDVHNTQPRAVDKGLYYIDLHLILGL